MCADMVHQQADALGRIIFQYALYGLTESEGISPEQKAQYGVTEGIIHYGVQLAPQ